MLLFYEAQWQYFMPEHVVIAAVVEIKCGTVCGSPD